MIKNKKHPCCGERGLYAAEDIPTGVPLLDYAGKISIVADEDHDTNKSSFILSLSRTRRRASSSILTPRAAATRSAS